jgi:signal transduction histidine kinase
MTRILVVEDEPGIALGLEGDLRLEGRAFFRKLFRGTAAAVANGKGSGVGLAMVRHIVAAHGGEMSVVSEPGEGSTFTILLPVGAER